MANAIHQPLNFSPSPCVTAREDVKAQPRVDLLWQEFLRAPSNWWDDHSTKRGPSKPDFRHKVTKEPLWMNRRTTPPWVRDELVRRGFLAEEELSDTAAGAFPALFIWTCCKSKDLLRGLALHQDVKDRGLDEKKYADALITMYAKCGELRKAQALLDTHGSMCVVPWTAMIAGYSQHGEAEKALSCFEEMQRKGVPPNGVTYVSVIKACTILGAIERGKQFHDDVLRQGLLECNRELGNALVDMYAKSGDCSRADAILKQLSARDVFSWTALISGYYQNGKHEEALECFEQMHREHVAPNARTFTYILKVCSMMGDLFKGKEIHAEISRRRLLKPTILSSALVEMYVDCGALSQAQSILVKLHSRSIPSWCALITLHVQMGQEKQALKCFDRMRHKNIHPDVPTYACLLKACADIGAINEGKRLHHEILGLELLKHNKELDLALSDMYAKCGAHRRKMP